MVPFEAELTDRFPGYARQDLPAAAADFDGVDAIGRLNGWVSGEFDFEAIRVSDSEDVSGTLMFPQSKRLKRSISISFKVCPDLGIRVHLLEFTSKERDAETRLDWFGARYMSAAQGRFTSPDKPLIGQEPMLEVAMRVAELSTAMTNDRISRAHRAAAKDLCRRRPIHFHLALRCRR
jgi:hypothetical protein